MKTFKEILGIESNTKTGFAIKTTNEKNKRKDSIKTFVTSYGDGVLGLTTNQKNKRMEKLLGVETKRVKGVGIKKSEGIEFKKYTLPQNILPEYETTGPIEVLSPDVLNNLDKYPRDIRAHVDDCRIINMQVNSDGSAIIEGIMIDGNEQDVLKRRNYNLRYPSDRELALLEIQQKRDGVLGEVSDRTMIIHDREGVLDILLEDDEIDTNEDKELQY